MGSSDSDEVPDVATKRRIFSKPASPKTTCSGAQQPAKSSTTSVGASSAELCAAKFSASVGAGSSSQIQILLGKRKRHTTYAQHFQRSIVVVHTEKILCEEKKQTHYLRKLCKDEVTRSDENRELVRLLEIMIKLSHFYFNF